MPRQPTSNRSELPPEAMPEATGETHYDPEAYAGASVPSLDAGREQHEREAAETEKRVKADQQTRDWEAAQDW